MNTSRGKVYITENLTCKSLAPLRVNTDGLEKYDPTRGIFW